MNFTGVFAAIARILVNRLNFLPTLFYRHLSTAYFSSTLTRQLSDELGLVYYITTHVMYYIQEKKTFPTIFFFQIRILPFVYNALLIFLSLGYIAYLCLIIICVIFYVFILLKYEVLYYVALFASRSFGFPNNLFSVVKLATILFIVRQSVVQNDLSGFTFTLIKNVVLRALVKRIHIILNCHK